IALRGRRSDHGTLRSRAGFPRAGGPSGCAGERTRLLHPGDVARQGVLGGPELVAESWTAPRLGEGRAQTFVIASPGGEDVDPPSVEGEDRHPVGRSEEIELLLEMVDGIV